MSGKTVTAVAVTAATINQWVFPLTQHTMICALKRFNCCNNDPHLLIWHSWLCSLLTVVFNLSWNLRLKISFACTNGKLACVTENMLKNESKKKIVTKLCLPPVKTFYTTFTVLICNFFQALWISERHLFLPVLIVHRETALPVTHWKKSGNPKWSHRIAIMFLFHRCSTVNAVLRSDRFFCITCHHNP